MKRLLYICILVLLCLPLVAQNEKISLQMHDVLFSEFVDSLEKKTLCKVFYADQWIDSMIVSVDAEHEEHGQILASALAGSGLTFIVTDNNQFILSKGSAIKTNFREEYEQYLADLVLSMDTTNYGLGREA